MAVEFDINDPSTHQSKRIVLPTEGKLLNPAIPYDRQSAHDLLMRVRDAVSGPMFACPDYDPVVELAKIAVARDPRDPTGKRYLADVKTRAACNKEVASYTHAKLAAVQLTGTGENGEVLVKHEHRHTLVKKVLEAIEAEYTEASDDKR